MEEQTSNYRYNDGCLKIGDYFIYEIAVYKISDKCASIISNKYIKSNKFIEVKEVEFIRRTKQYSIQRFITLLYAPIAFIKENKLPVYKLKSKNNAKRKN